MAALPQYIRWFETLSLDDVPLVGGKNASLGELYRELVPLGVKVPNGFAVTARAYRDLLARSGANETLRVLMQGLNKTDVLELSRRGREARRLIFEAGISDPLRTEIIDAYHQLLEQYGPETTVAVRSSATAEDLPTASFAGQQESYLNVHGDEMLLDMCRRCFASLFTDRAISYRIDHGFNHLDVALSIGIQKMVRADRASSGVMFTLDTESGFRDVVFITGAYGLGENVVQGAVDPDEFYVHKPTFLQGHRAVLRRVLAKKQIKMVYAADRTRGGTRNIPTPKSDQRRFCLSDEEVLTLAGYAIKVEQHYSRRQGEDRPMDMEWAKDGVDGQLYLVQARPETVESQVSGAVLKEYILQDRSEAVVSGRAVGAKVAAGRVRVIPEVTRLSEFQAGEVLVADSTTPDWEPVMKTAAAIVTNRGGRTCHAAIVARELGIPAVVGTEEGTDILHDGQMVTISCSEGDVGQVYEGELPFEIRETNLEQLPRPGTKIMLNLGNPEVAFRTSRLPNDGVGLARMEFIINEYIKVHPMALLHLEKIIDDAERATIELFTQGYARPADFFIERLSEGIGTIAAAFYPKPVIVRLSDFKSNEYANLLGGRAFEPQEENPMLGFRGAARYIHPSYREGFALECAALRRAREEMGLSNIILMVPFCRRVEEGRQVLALMAEHGLRRNGRSKNGLKVYMMCEIPNNVLQIDAFAKLFDGFSIGSNDLTQLVLGVDRDSEILAEEFDERDPGVLEMIRLTVEGAKRNGKYSGICGQAPSDFPEITEFLVRQGIESISLNPDTAISTTLEVLDLEAKLDRGA